MQHLSEGELVKLNNKYMFKLDSHPANPIITPQQLGLTWYEDDTEYIGAVFNGGAEFYPPENKFMVLPRIHKDYRKVRFYDKKMGIERWGLENYVAEIWVLESYDGVHFNPRGTIIKGDGTEHRDFTYGIEDIRVVKHDGAYLLIGCGKIGPPFFSHDSDRIAVYSTSDFRNITYHGIVDVFTNRNAIPVFTKRASYIFLRFHPHIYLAPLEEGIDQLLHPKKYRPLWRKIYEHRDEFILLRAGELSHGTEKLGPGTQLIPTDEGYLFIYHAVGEIPSNIARIYGLDSGIERAYSVNVMLLDKDVPHKIIAMSESPVYIPHKLWELYGDEKYPVDIPAVVFPVGATVRDGYLFVYGGAADKYEILLTCKLDNLIEYLLKYGVRGKD